MSEPGIPSLREVRVADVCPTISHRFRVTEDGADERDATLIVSFSGVYRAGSEGNPDAEYMRVMVELGLQMWWTGSVVIDISDLDYEWGEAIDAALQKNEYRPTAIVVGPGCEAALATLWFDSGREATDAEGVFTSLAEAIGYVRRASNVMRARLEN